MAAVDMTSFAYATKEFFNDQKVEWLTYTERPLLALLPKKRDFYGESYRLPQTYSNIPSRSQTFATAYTNKGTFSGAKFLLTRDHDYALADLDNETRLSTSNNKGAFMAAAAATVEAAISAISDSLEINLFGNSSGSRGQVGAYTGGATTFTLSDIEDVVKYEVGMIIVADDTATGASPRTGSGTVTNVNRDTGVITGSAAWDTAITGFAVNDYLFAAGDTGGNAMISGLSAWVPDTAPTSTPFFGVDRSVDTSRLGGIRFNGTGLAIEEALNGTAYLIHRDGAGRPDFALLGLQKYRDLINDLGDKVRYMDHKIGEVGFTTIMVTAGRGPIKVMGCWAQKNTRAHLIQSDTWGLYSLGMAPQMIEEEGGGKLWHYNLSTDSWQLTVGYYAQLGCSAVGKNGVGHSL